MLLWIVAAQSGKVRRHVAKRFGNRVIHDELDMFGYSVCVARRCIRWTLNLLDRVIEQRRVRITLASPRILFRGITCFVTHHGRTLVRRSFGSRIVHTGAASALLCNGLLLGPINSCYISVI